MIKDYIVIDNILPNPDEVRKDLLSKKYFSNESFELNGLDITYDNSKPAGKWRGFRTQNLVKSNADSCKELFEPIFFKLFGNNINLSPNDISLFGHLSSELMNDRIQEKKKWHVDNEECFAGVIYLTPSPKKHSGTFLKLRNKILEVENRYNRLVFYRSNVLHSPGYLFGTNSNDSRLTLTIFIHKITFTPVVSEQELY